MTCSLAITNMLSWAFHTTIVIFRGLQLCCSLHVPHAECYTWKTFFNIRLFENLALHMVIVISSDNTSTIHCNVGFSQNYFCLNISATSFSKGMSPLLDPNIFSIWPSTHTYHIQGTPTLSSIHVSHAHCHVCGHVKFKQPKSISKLSTPSDCHCI